jgi:hypothetical protein
LKWSVSARWDTARDERECGAWWPAWEPAVAGASAKGVRLVTQGFGAAVVPVEWSPRPLVGSAAATRLGTLVEDVSLVGPMLALAGHEGYQSPGRVMALLKGEGAQEYRLCAKGTDVASLPSGALPGNSTSLATSLQGALQSDGVVLSDSGLLVTEPETYGLQPGFAYIPAVGGTAEARAVAAEDGRVPLGLVTGHGGRTGGRSHGAYRPQSRWSW